MSGNRMIGVFVFGAAVVLFVFSVELLRVLLVAGPVLRMPDALLPFSSKAVLYFISGASLSLSAFLLLGGTKQIILKLYLLAWFASNLCIYQAGALWIHGADLLGCLGNLDHRIPISPMVLVPMMLALFSVLLFADLLLIAYLHLKSWKSKRDSGPAFVASQSPSALPAGS